jgi:hypothetical protein
MSSKDHPQFGVPEVYSALVWKMDIVRSKDVVTAFRLKHRMAESTDLKHRMAE